MFVQKKSLAQVPGVEAEAGRAGECVEPCGQGGATATARGGKVSVVAPESEWGWRRWNRAVQTMVDPLTSSAESPDWLGAVVSGLESRQADQEKSKALTVPRMGRGRARTIVRGQGGLEEAKHGVPQSQEP